MIANDMILDFNNLTIKQVKRLNKINTELQLGFNDLINQFLNNTDKDLAYLVSITASRNTYQGSLYFNILKLVLAQELLNEGKVEKIIFPSKVLKDVFVLNNKNIKIPIEVSRDKRNKSILKQLAHIFLMVFSLFVTKKRKSKEQFSGKEFILIETFILSNSIKVGKYIDRYYNGLWELLTDAQKNSVYFLPEILGYFKRKDINRIRDNSSENLLFKQDFLKLSDYVKAFYRLIKLKYPKSRFIIRGLDVSKLLKHEFSATRFNSSAFKGILNYYFVKRLKENNIKLDLLIDWNENQPIDKGLIKGVRDFYPEVHIKGYQGYIISTEFNFYIQPPEYEIENGVIPDEICVVGKVLEHRIKRFFNNIKASTAPAFRFTNVYKTYKRDDFNKRLLVALPIGVTESYDILTLISKALKKTTVNFQIQIKPHPSLNLKKTKTLLGELWRKDFEIIDGDFNEKVSQSDLLIGSTSSTLLETLSRGIPVIVVGSQNGITQNPIPSSVNHKIWKLVYTPEELAEAINFYMNASDKDKEEYSRIGNDMKDGYFAKVTKQEVYKFLDINK